MGYFQPNYQHPLLYSESLVHVFHYSNIFLQKTKPLYPHPEYLFGIGIWIWAAKNKGFSLRASVVRALGNGICLKLHICNYLNADWRLFVELLPNVEFEKNLIVELKKFSRKLKGPDGLLCGGRCWGTGKVDTTKAMFTKHISWKIKRFKW